MKENNVIFSQHELELLIEKVKKNRLLKDIFKDLNRISLKIEVGDEQQQQQQQHQQQNQSSVVDHSTSSSTIGGGIDDEIIISKYPSISNNNLINFNKTSLNHFDFNRHFSNNRINVHRSGNLTVKEILPISEHDENETNNDDQTTAIIVSHETNNTTNNNNDQATSKLYDSDASLNKIISSSEEDEEEHSSASNSNNTSCHEEEMNVENNDLEELKINEMDGMTNRVKDIASLSSLSSQNDEEEITIAADSDEIKKHVDDELDETLATVKVVELCEPSLPDLSIETNTNTIVSALTIAPVIQNIENNCQIIEEDSLVKSLTIKGHNRHILLKAKNIDSNETQNGDQSKKPRIIQMSLGKKMTLKINQKYLKPNKLNKQTLVHTHNNTNNIAPAISNLTNFKLNEQYVSYIPPQPVPQQQIYSYHPPHQFHHQPYNNNNGNNKRYKTFNNNKKNESISNSFHLMATNTPIDSATSPVLNTNANASINYQPSYHNPYYYNYHNQTASYVPIYLNQDQVGVGSQTQASYIPADTTTVIDPNNNNNNNNNYYYMMPAAAAAVIQAQQPPSQYQVLPSNIPNTNNNSKLKLTTYYGYPLNSY